MATWSSWNGTRGAGKGVLNSCAIPIVSAPAPARAGLDNPAPARHQCGRRPDEGKSSRVHERGQDGKTGCHCVGNLRNCTCEMKTTEAERKYAAKQGIAEEESLKKGMEAKSKEFVEKGAEVYAKA